jgi:hypothetical protein
VNRWGVKRRARKQLALTWQVIALRFARLHDHGQKEKPTMSDDKSRDRSARALVLLSAVVFLGYGVEALLFPNQLARLVDIQLSSPSALADFRALYSAVPLAIGALLVQGLRDPHWFAPSLFLSSVSLACAAEARLYSIAVSGMPNELVLTFLALELLGLVWALSIYLRPKRRSVFGEAGRQHA